MTVAGVDIGSVATKAVVLKNSDILGYAVTPTGADPARAAETALAGALKQASIRHESVQRIMGTGYGRRATPIADEVITEITAAAHGARRICPTGAGTIIDLGGQDTKVIALDDARIRTFLMNDKCAAGTGKFLEVMAHVLGVSLDTLADMALRADAPASLSSTCTVFAESEVISLIHRGARKETIAAGLHAAIAGRIAAMVSQVGLNKDVVFIGGGARNRAMHRALQNILGVNVHVPDNPQFTVATGAALIAERHLR